MSGGVSIVKSFRSKVYKEREVEPRSTSEPQTGVKSYPKVIMQLE